MNGIVEDTYAKQKECENLKIITNCPNEQVVALVLSHLICKY